MKTSTEQNFFLPLEPAITWCAKPKSTQVPGLFGHEKKWICHHKTKDDRVASSQLFVTNPFHWLVIAKPTFQKMLCGSFWIAQYSSPAGCDTRLLGNVEDTWDFILAGVPRQQPCSKPLLHTKEGQMNGYGAHRELLKWSQQLGTKVTTARPFLAAGLVLGGQGSGGWVGSMGYSAMVLKCPHFIITLRHTLEPWGMARLLINEQQAHLSFDSEQ